MLSLCMMMVVIHNRLKGMYIHYELCILRFYEVCLDLVSFCLLGLSANHGRRFWVVTKLVSKPCCLSSVQRNVGVVCRILFASCINGHKSRMWDFYLILCMDAWFVCVIFHNRLVWYYFRNIVIWRKFGFFWLRIILFASLVILIRCVF